MKSRTSFSKLTPLKKDITRYAPLWLLYIIAMDMVLLSSLSDYSPSQAASFFSVTCGFFSICNLIYAYIAAAALFGDLFNSKLCYSLHALPQRREDWFFTHVTAGLSFSLVPNLITAALLMTVLEEFWFVALLWVLIMTLQYLFYFGIATLSVHCAGNQLGALAIYGLLNFFSLLAYGFCYVIFEPQMYGVVINADSFYQLCPTVQLCNSTDFLRFEAVDTVISDYSYDTFYTTTYAFVGLGTGWGYAVVIALIGVAAMGLALLLYRRRDLERAGDFVAFSWLAPVACVVLTLAVGLICACMGELMSSNYLLWLAVGVAVGYFGSRMLLERRVKVFHPRSLAGLAAIAAVLGISLWAIHVDLFGIVTWLPEASQVESVAVANYSSDSIHYYYYDCNRIRVELTETEDIDEIIQAHADILERGGEDYNGGTHYVTLEYQLKSGLTVRRSYNAPADGTNYEILSEYFYTPQQILGYTDWEEYKANVSYIWLDNEIPTMLYDEFLEALKLDCESGQVFISGNASASYWADIEVYYPDGTYVYRNLGITDQAVNTIAVLQKPETLMGYTDWETYLDSVTYVYVYGNVVEDWQALLEALRLDCENGNVTSYFKSTSGVEIDIEIAYPDDYFYRTLVVTEAAENTWAWIQEHGY